MLFIAVRALVEQRLQTELTGERKAFLDRQIDHELANMWVCHGRGTYMTLHFVRCAFSHVMPNLSLHVFFPFRKWFHSRCTKASILPVMCPSMIFSPFSQCNRNFNPSLHYLCQARIFSVHLQSSLDIWRSMGRCKCGRLCVISSTQALKYN